MPVRRILLAWLLLWLALSSPLTQANTNPTAVLRDLHAAQMKLHATATAFHRYQGSEGDRRQLVRLNEALVELKASFQAAFQDLAELDMKAELEQVRGHWRDAARFLNTAMTAIAGKGFAEGQVTNGYLLHNYHTSQALKKAYLAVLKTTGVRIPAVLQSLREQTVLFQEMTALYMEHSTAQYAYTYRSEAGDDETLDKMAQRFSFGLEDIEKQLAGNADAIKRLNHARNKWRFLEKSFLNYRENTVPYLVEKFGPEITAELQALAAGFDRG